MAANTNGPAKLRSRHRAGGIYAWFKPFKRHASLAIVTAAILFGLHHHFEKHPYVRNFEYSLLQQSLAKRFAVESFINGQRNDRRIPAVIDISDIPMKREPNGDLATDRAVLEELVDKVLLLKATAVGIDIDMSPDVDGHLIDEADPRLFHKWLTNAKAKGKIRVGVQRYALHPADLWLARSEFQGLAAGISMPKDDQQYAYFFTAPPAGDATPADRLMQLPVALETIVDPRFFETEMSLDKHLVEDEDTEFSARRFPLDYSGLDALPIIRYNSSTTLDPDTIAGRTVLIGDERDNGDTSCLAGRREPVSRLLIHASALITMNRGFLVDVRPEFSARLDAGLMVFFIVAMGFTYRAHRTVPAMEHVEIHELEIWFSLIVGGLLLIGGFYLVSTLGLFWPDFLWISAIFFLHPYFSGILDLFFRAGHLVTTSGSKEKVTDAH